MGKYIKLFNSHSDYEDFTESEDFILPNVSRCDFEKDMHYTPKPYDYSQDYLTFKTLESGTFSFSNSINYSIDNGQTWVNLASNTATPTISAGSNIMWKVSGLTPTSSTGIGTFSSTGKFDVEGNIMSLVGGDNFTEETTTMSSYQFFRLFRNCVNLVSAKHLILPVTTLALTSCYYAYMFQGCTSLTTAPELPATTLGSQCYFYMFDGCISLATTPELPVLRLASNCYEHMFSGCTSLTTTPELPATTLANGCYSGMFQNCTSLITAPTLPVTTLATYCYSSMFENCTNLETAPELLATTLVNSCYYAMFKGCSKINYMKADYQSSPGSAYDFLINTAQQGTFIKNPNLSTLYVSNYNAVHSTHTPPTWTIVSSFTINTINGNGVFTTTPAFWTYPVRANNTLHIILNNVEFVGTVTKSSDTYTYIGTSDDKTLTIELIPSYDSSHFVTSYSAQYTIQNMTLTANDVVSCSYYYDS